MADQNEAKTKTIGFLPIEKAQSLRGWDEYIDKSTELSVLRTEAQKAKSAVRDALKERRRHRFCRRGRQDQSSQGLSEAAREADEVIGSVLVLS
jgi:hypothetical protein